MASNLHWNNTTEFQQAHLMEGEILKNCQITWWISILLNLMEQKYADMGLKLITLNNNTSSSISIQSLTIKLLQVGAPPTPAS